jgi:hypothetical protein
VDVNEEQVLVEADTLQERRTLEGILRSLSLSLSYMHTVAMQLACPANQPALLAQLLRVRARGGASRVLALCVYGLTADHPSAVGLPKGRAHYCYVDRLRVYRVSVRWVGMGACLAILANSG